MVVPSTFIGSSKHHLTNYHDAMPTYRAYGPPDLCVNFVHNIKWRIYDVLRFEPRQQLVLYTVEFQKHGVAYAHCLVWLAPADSEFSASICPEIASPNELHENIAARYLSTCEAMWLFKNDFHLQCQPHRQYNYFWLEVIL